MRLWYLSLCVAVFAPGHYPDVFCLRHLSKKLLLFAHWVAHACILCMLRFCGDHLSLWDVQRVQWMLAPSCCAWRISCGGHYRYRMCDFPSWLPLKEGNHDSHLLGPEVQVRFVLYLFFLFLFFLLSAGTRLRGKWSCSRLPAQAH